MHVVITGGGGFIGNRVARELFRRRQLALAPGQAAHIDSITLADLSFSPQARARFDSTVSFVEADLGDPAAVDALFSRQPAAIFHLAAMVSGEGERDFDGCLRINLDGTRALLEAARRSGLKPRTVFASSLAVFGGSAMPPVATDATRQVPQTTYGMTKAIGELLINEYSRKGFVDGRAARLPTVFIRPGRPNAAASSFASGLFREPLAGVECLLPVPRSVAAPLLGYRRVVENLIRLMECDGEALGDDRSVNFPSTRFLISDMIQVLEKVAARHGIALGPIVDRPDPIVMRIVQGWPVGTEATRANGLGMVADQSVEQVIEDYIEDFASGRKADVKG